MITSHIIIPLPSIPLLDLDFFFGSNRSHLRTFTTKLGSPFLAALDILLTDGWSGTFDSFDEVFEEEWWLEELVAVDLGPGHLHGAFVAWGAGCEFLFAVNHNLVFC